MAKIQLDIASDLNGRDSANQFLKVIYMLKLKAKSLGIGPSGHPMFVFKGKKSNVRILECLYNNHEF